MQPALLILAAGMGNRYGGLKQLDAIGAHAETLLEYSIFDAIEAGFKKLLFVVRKEFESEFESRIIKRIPANICVQFVYQDVNKIPKGFDLTGERIKPWGTGHAVLMAKGAIETHFVIINADDFYGKESFKKLYTFLSKPKLERNDCCMVGFELQKTLSEHGTVSRGICEIDSYGYLQKVEEFTKIGLTNEIIVDEVSGKTFQGNEIVSMNMWGVSPMIFKVLEEEFKQFLKKNISDPKSEFFLPSVINGMIEKDKIKLKVLESKDTWFGITYQEDKLKVQNEVTSLIQKGYYPQKLWN